MNKILLIGGCGYIGSQLFNFLNKKYNIESVDLELFGNPGIDNYKINYKDLTEDYLLQFSDIILLAGHSSVKMCENNLIGCFKNNVEYFVNLLTKIRDHQKFIYASSSSVYGNVNRNIVNEDCEEYVAGSFYDLSKAEIDHYAKIFDKVNYYGLRFGTVNGFSPNIRTDIMINAMTNSIFETNAIKVFNPMVKRPILWIHDLCRAIEKIIQDGDFSKRGVYNLASFNSTVDIIGRKVSSLFQDSNLQIIENETLEKELELNKKLHSKVYDFAISSDKFITTFDFQFEGTIEIITKELKEKFNMIKLRGPRNEKNIII
jgi:UDP-glucose 4-epimerase